MNSPDHTRALHRFKRTHEASALATAGKLMDRDMLLDHLALAERHVKEGERHLTQQAALVHKLEVGGQDTAEAEALLKQFQELQVMHIADRERIKAELQQLGSP